MPAPSDALIDIIKALLVPGGLLATATAVVLGWRKGPGTAKPLEATVVSATIADANAVRSLVEAVQHLTSVMISNRAESIVERAEEQARQTKLIATIDELTAALRRNGLPPDWLAALSHLRD